MQSEKIPKNIKTFDDLLTMINQATKWRDINKLIEYNNS